MWLQSVYLLPAVCFPRQYPVIVHGVSGHAMPALGKVGMVTDKVFLLASGRVGVSQDMLPSNPSGQTLRMTQRPPSPSCRPPARPLLSWTCAATQGAWSMQVSSLAALASK